MGLFNKKPKAEATPKPQTAEDIMKLIESLPDDEFDKLSDMLLADDDDNGKPDTIEQIDKAKENIEAKGEDTQTEQDRIDESVAEQEKADGDEDSQDAKDRVDEAEGEEEHLEEEKEEENAPEAEEEKPEETPVEEKKDEVMNALVARIEALEERVANLVERAEDKPFGNYSAESTEVENDGSTEDSRIMKNYMRKQAYR